MTSKIDICNMALAEVGTRSSVVNLQEGSPEANNCQMFYDPVRRQMLRAANWNFARKPAPAMLLLAAFGTAENPTIPTLANWTPGQTPLPPWLYEYAYPPDCLRLRQVKAQANPTGPAGGLPMFSVNQLGPAGRDGDYNRFEVGTDLDPFANDRTVILTNVPQAILIYTRDIDNTSLFDSIFEEGLVAALAGKLAIALTGKDSLAKQLLDRANETILQARIADANEGTTRLNHTPDWLRVRGSHSADWGYDDLDYSAPYGGMFTL